MRIHTVDLPRDWDCAYIIPISDLHIGDANFDERKFKRYLDWITEEERARIILVGDIMNTATKDSVSDSYHETMNPNDQLRYANMLLQPVKDKILIMTDGNHEKRIAKSTSIDTSQMLANMLGVPYEPNGFFVKIRVGNNDKGKPHVYSLYATHGFGGGKMVGGKMNNLQSLSKTILADIYVMAHIHMMATFQDIYLVPDLRNNKVDEVKRTYVSSASFVKWGGYAQQYGFTPSKIGTPRIRLEGKVKKDVHVSI